MLTTRDFLSGYMNNHEEYTISYPRKILPPVGTEHFNFLKQLHQTIFTEPNVFANWRTAHNKGDFNCSMGQSGAAFQMFYQADTESPQKYSVLWKDANLKFRKIPSLCGDDVYSGNYAVITTRARIDGGLNNLPNILNMVKKTLDILNANYSRIVIVGEKADNTLHRNKFDPAIKSPSLYHFILENINKDKMLDLTSTGLSMENFKYENAVCRDAKKVVTFGCGGNYARQLYIGSNLSAAMCMGCYNHPATMRLRSLQSLNSPTVENFNLFSYTVKDHTEAFYRSLAE